MPEISLDIPIEVPYGLPNYYSVWIKDGGTEYNYSAKLLRLQLIKRRNNIWSMEIVFRGLTTTDKQNIAVVGNTFKFFSQNTILLHARITDVKYTTLTETTIYGRGIVVDRLINRVGGRVSYTNTANTTVFTNFLSGTGVSAGTNSAYGNVTIQSEFDSVFNSVSHLAEQTNFEFWESWGSYPYDSLVFNQSLNKGTGISKMTFTRTGAGANLIGASNNADRQNQVNDVIVLGYGDGINQLKSESWHSTTDRTALNGAITAAATSITVDSTTGLAASDKLRIGNEVITISSVDSGITLTVSRSATDEDGTATTAYAHDDNIEVFKYFDNGTGLYLTPKTGRAEAGASIQDQDASSVVQVVIRKREIQDQNALDRIAQETLSKFKDPVERIIIRPARPKTVLGTIDVGDTITVTDTLADLSGTYEISGLTLRWEPTGESLLLELSNEPLDETKNITISKDAIQKESSYMQGATNIYTVSETDNLEDEASPTGNPAAGALDIFFPIPDDAVAINSIKLSYRLEKPKTWSDVSAGGESADYANAIRQIYDVGQTQDTSSSNMTATVQSTSPAQGTYNGVVCSVTIFNRSSATDTYTYTVKNGVTTLSTITNQSIAQDALNTQNFSYTSAQVAAGDTLTLTVTDGIVGTRVGIGNFGYVEMTLQSRSIHTHTITYDTITQTYGATDIRIFSTNDASGTPSWTERTAAIEAVEGTLTASENGTETDIDITSFFSGVGWKGIRIVANGACRCKAFVTPKVFVQSKVV